ncbi:MAG: DUF4019 domain-containing protein [Thermodesulfobacteriota bacterium]|nr:DUF4019 domain-containing protein [Thermodesulfobacteriota bacterium]
MKKSSLPTLFTLLLLSFTSIYCFAEQQTDLAAIIAAEKFVETLDKSEFSVAWNQTSIVNQSYAGHPDWFKKILAARPYLGQVQSRSLEKLSRHASWVGLPDGDYLRISFTTLFLNKADSLETVVLIKEQGTWMVSSYHLR